MLIENGFTVQAPAEALWRLLLDVERIVPCMSGAELTETIDDRHWKGRLHVKFGPVSMSFAGTVAMQEREEAHLPERRERGLGLVEQHQHPAVQPVLEEREEGLAVRLLVQLAAAV